MLCARIAPAAGRLRGRDEVARALAAQSVVHREVALHLARVDAPRDRGELVDRPPRARASRTACVHRAGVERVGDARPRPRPPRSGVERARASAIIAGDLVARGEQRRQQPACRSRPLAPARKTLTRAPRSARPPRAAALGHHAHQPSLKPAGVMSKALVEARAHVLERDHVRQLDQLALVEVRAQRREQLSVDVRGRAAHRDSRSRARASPAREFAAVAVARQRQHLRLADARLAREARADVAAELAVDERRRLQHGERLQPLGDALSARRSPARRRRSPPAGRARGRTRRSGRRRGRACGARRGTRGARSGPARRGSALRFVVIAVPPCGSG